MYVPFSFDYRQVCTRSAATLSMPTGLSLTLGTWAQISFARICFCSSASTDWTTKGSSRAASTPKDARPTAKFGMQRCLKSGWPNDCTRGQTKTEEVRSENPPPAILPSPPLFPSVILQCTGSKYANTFKCVCLSSAKRLTGTAADALFAIAGVHCSTIPPSFFRVLPTFMLMTEAYDR